MSATGTGEDEIQRVVDSLNSVYRSISQNETLRVELNRSSITPTQWREVDAVLTPSTPRRKAATNDLYTLYQGLGAMLAVVKVLATEVRPSVRYRVLQARQGRATPSALLKMTAANLDGNIKLLLERLTELYKAVSRLDETQNGKARTIGAKFPELADPATWAVGE